jgi:Tol biopolymer transport system component
MVCVTHEEIPLSALAEVERDGTTRILTEGRRFYSPHVSPDGDRVLVSTRDADSNSLWIYDLARDTLTPVTFEERPNKISYSPAIWTPDGERITFGSAGEDNAEMNMYWMMADGSGQAEELLPKIGFYLSASSWSPDGKVLAFNKSFDIWMLRIEDEPQLHPFLQTHSWEMYATFSPDGRWLAYSSDESGQVEVYVQPYPGPGEKVQISNNGGIHPVWARSSRELFYWNGSRMMTVPVELGTTFVAGQPSRVFEGDYEVGGPGYWVNYDVSPDGESFLMIKRTTEPPREINVVLNWFEELKRLAQ